MNQTANDSLSLRSDLENGVSPEVRDSTLREAPWERRYSLILMNVSISYSLIPSTASWRGVIPVKPFP